MGKETEKNTQQGLAKGVVGYREVLAQGIASGAPAAATIGTLTGAAAFAYGALPLAVAIALIMVLLDATRLSIIARYVQSAGGIYAFIERGLGKKVAFVASMAYTIYIFAVIIFVYLIMGLMVPTGIEELGINLPSWIWIPLGLVNAIVSVIISYLGIRPSLKFTLIMSIAEITGIIATSILIFSKIPPDINTFTLAYVPPPKISNLGLGVSFGILAFTGYETVSVLGEEAKDPRNNIAKGVFTAALLLGITYIVGSEAFTVGWGVNNMSTYFNYLAPGLILAKTFGGTILLIILTALLINSNLACATGFTNCVTRVMYAMSVDKLLPSKLSSIHPKRRTPHIASLFTFIFTALYFIIMSLIFSPSNIFIATGITTTFGFLIAIFVVNISMLIVVKKNNALNIGNILIVAIVEAIIGYVFYATVITSAINVPVLIGVLTLVLWVVGGIIYLTLKRFFTQK
ncbi:APC family permease [Saccharolobus solfataricus]|nr:APC family permease [Saccharolobus solfataricus]AKA74633.1 APC family permease [Saccharolobus solfataricus]AKA77327.1 APC family permease [Saccharolobus solfataricus]AKA80018.1 APC family permease [Saccharolobus solfataricus]AZF69100.1 APC family permease [Saccharolobus solfataricus]AZF71720.1 APC family permease [Saccharolobus solfataricus]